MAVELPPAVALLADEFRGKTLHFEKVRKRFDDDGFLDDLAEQSKYSLAHFDYADREQPPHLSAFHIFAAGGLNPFSAEAKCSHIPCRIAQAHHFARTACLYADRVIVPDEFSWSALTYSADTAFVKIAILKTLLPLVEQGVVAFSSPAFAQCRGCGSAGGAASKKVSKELWREFLKTVDVFPFKYGRQWRLSFGSPLFVADGEETPMTVGVPRRLLSSLTPHEPVVGREAARWARECRPMLEPHLSSFAATLVFESRLGSFCHATVATNSNAGAAGFRILDSRLSPLT